MHQNVILLMGLSRTKFMHKLSIFELNFEKLEVLNWNFAVFTAKEPQRPLTASIKIPKAGPKTVLQIITMKFIPNFRVANNKEILFISIQPSFLIPSPKPINFNLPLANIKTKHKTIFSNTTFSIL